ncbi:MAG: hypothetical protein M5E90_03925 [Asgard group archaeon]|nr:hypothetical protein [Asgard group archaeon]
MEHFAQYINDSRVSQIEKQLPTGRIVVSGKEPTAKFEVVGCWMDTDIFKM